MKLHQTPPGGHHLFTGYGAHYVAVNAMRYETSVVVTPESVKEWRVESFAALTAADFAFVAEMKPEIVVFGSGLVQRFPRPELARALSAAGMGLEVMDSKAACRTYNILAAEGRKVVAAILVE